MNYAGFCAPSNQSQSPVADAERTLNWYFEKIQSPYAPTAGALYPTPGRKAFLTVPDVGGRDLFVAAGRCFGVIGAGFYEFFETGLFTKWGPVAQNTYPATISYNGAAGGQLFVTSGNNGYCFVLGTNALTQVLTNEATMGGMVDGRFLAFNINTGQVKLSPLNDGTSFTAQAFNRSAAPDRWQAMVIVNREIWLIGEETSEVWYNSGATPQPFALIPGSLMSEGTIAPFSVKKVGDGLAWVTRTLEGAGRIVRARGYEPQTISNYSVETAIARYARSGSLAGTETLVYEQEGHEFAAFTFLFGGTWVVDTETGAWHERDTNGGYWAPRVHCYAFNKHLVADRTSGILAEMDIAFADDLGSPIRRLRMGPPIWASARQRMLLSRFDLFVEPGLGLTSGQGSNPQLMLRTSTDAKTWSAERQMAAGKRGRYQTRVFATRLGSSDKLWVPEVSVTDPIPWRLLGCEIDGTGFQSRRAA